jgi:hypothetical protein
MMEISLTELMLLVWAVAASAAWWHMRDEERKAKFLLRAFVEDEKVREQVLRSYAEFKARHE